ncbi:magnesium and cobalt transport protein CorA [Streptomyces sp. NPDC049577]|uniref:magnesium and cobalt transport protein CorA n=1 Tax=Streptomyces sp. NPDC049577 TaxID=3155153 RepID=UPI003447FD60
MWCLIYRERGGDAEKVDCDQADGHCRRVVKRLRELGGETFGWVHLADPDERELTEIASELGLHPLAVEDAVRDQHRPKLERYGDDVLALGLKPLRYVKETSAVETGRLMVFLGPRHILTVHHGPADPAPEAARRLEADRTTLRFGPAAVLHAVLDVTVDAYTDAGRSVGDDLSEIERRVFSATRDDLTEEIYSLKREVLEFRDAVQPLVGVLQDLTDRRSRWPQEAAPYFRDVADHLHHGHAEVRSMDELLNSVLDAHLARVGTWQNDDMRRISAWAAILAVPTMVAGLYGMNFQHMPELHWAYGYPCALGVMALAAGALYRAFRRNGWL